MKSCETVGTEISSCNFKIWNAQFMNIDKYELDI